MSASGLVCLIAGVKPSGALSLCQLTVKFQIVASISLGPRAGTMQSRVACDL